MKKSGILLSATKSGSGKTLITCALLKALALREKKVCAFKCGPDYIDPMFHQKVLGIPSGNLDLFFSTEEQVRELYEREGLDVNVVEGVMGLYDGLGGITEEASAYHLACALDLPILLIVDTHGMGRSVLAEIAGFLSMDQEKRIRGILLNRMSENLYTSMKPMIEERFAVPVFGYMKTLKNLELDSRYLGLKLPEEIAQLEEKVILAAKALEETVDLDGILKLMTETFVKNPSDEICKKENTAVQKEEGAFGKDYKATCRIGVAKDEAFCFYYRENLEMIQSIGGEIVYFSPLKDQKLPENLDGILLGGGYPELRARELSENLSMRNSVKEALEDGMPSLAECGGFMYLHEGIKTSEGEEYPWVGAVKGNCFYTGKLVRFGYATFSDGEIEIKGHEFHYYDSECNGNSLQAEKPINGRHWECCHKTENSLWGYPHFYYRSCPELIKWFLKNAKEYQQKRRTS